MTDQRPHYPNQADRDAAAAGAGLIVILILGLVLTLGFVAGCTFRAVVG